MKNQGTKVFLWYSQASLKSSVPLTNRSGLQKCQGITGGSETFPSMLRLICDAMCLALVLCVGLSQMVRTGFYLFCFVLNGSRKQKGFAPYHAKEGK